MLAIGGIGVEWQDVIEEPDGSRVVRLSRFVSLLRAAEVRSLPRPFWFQLLVAAVTLVAASWIMVC